MSTPLNILFVCAKNQWRSPTAAHIYRNDSRLSVQSAGLRPQSPCQISLKHLQWADVVMVMEKAHAARIRDIYRSKTDLPEIISLDIPDDYPFMDKVLIEILKQAVGEVLLDYFDE